jgi:hypothetical protein
MTTQTLYLIDEYLTQGGYTPGIDAETLEREAVLVAAAPDLLAALENLTVLFDRMDRSGATNKSAYNDAIAAITKARGQ